MKLSRDRLFAGRLIYAVVTLMAITAFNFTVFAISATSTAEAAKKNSLTVAMALTPLSAPVIIAQKRGFFAANGLNVTIKDVSGGHRAIRTIFEGKADISTSSEVVVMFKSMTRSDFSIICSFVSSDKDTKIVAHKDSGIQTIKDLVGKRVGTVTGTSAQFFLDQTLLFGGVNSSSVKVVHIDPEEAPVFLASKKVDAIAVWEPYAYLTRVKLGNQAVVIPHERNYTETFNAIALKSFVASHPATIEKFLAALLQAVSFINDNPEETQHIVAQRIDQDHNFIKSVWSDFTFGITMHQWLITTLESEARWAVAAGHIDQRMIPNYLDYLYLDALERLKPENITIYR